MTTASGDIGNDHVLLLLKRQILKIKILVADKREKKVTLYIIVFWMRCNGVLSGC